MAFLRRLEDVLNTSHKRCYLCDVFNSSSTYLKKDFYSVTSAKCLKSTSCKCLRLFKNSQGCSDGYLKCSIQGTNNQILIRFYEPVHLQLFNAKYKYVYLQLFSVKSLFPEENFLDNSIGESTRRISEKKIDHNSRDQKPHVYKHSCEKR